MSSPLRPAVFLDRDGTLNIQHVRDGKPFPPRTVEEFILFPEAASVCAELAAVGFVLVVATNQPDVGRGTQPQALVEAMHGKLRREIPALARIEVCFDPGTAYLPPGTPPNPRRKPAPGMLLDAAAALGLDLHRSWMVGDRWRDIECGQRAGTRTIFIDFGYDEKAPIAPDFTVASLTEAARIILAHS